LFLRVVGLEMVGEFVGFLAFGLLRSCRAPTTLVPEGVRETGRRGTQECKNSRMVQEEEAELSRWWQFRSGKSTINF
jgi:hypothetical protein